MTVTQNGRGLKKIKAPVTETNVRIATVPDASVATKYISRKVGGREDLSILDFAKGKGYNVLLEGDTGAGKTLFAMAYAASRQMYFYSVPNNVGIEPSMLFGKFIPDASGVGLAVWQDGPVTDLVRHGGVLLINEINFLPPRVATVLFSLLDGRREIVLLEHKGEIIRAHQGKGCWCGADDCTDKQLLVIGDMNPDYLGTQPLNAAFRNRFEIQLEWDYDPNVEKELVRSGNLLKWARNARKSRREGSIITPTSTNMLIEFETLVDEFSIDFAMGVLVQHYDAEDRKAVSDSLKTYRANFEVDYAPAPKAKPKEEKKKSRGNGWDILDDSDVSSWLMKGKG